MTAVVEGASSIAPGAAADTLVELFPLRSVLTAPGGKFELKPDLRQLCALTADGKLHVSTQHSTDQYVMAFMDQLEHTGFEYEVIPCSMTDIKAIYQASEQSVLASSQVETDRQAQAVAILADAHKREE